MLNIDFETTSEGTSTLVTIRGDFDLQVAEDVAARLAEVESTRPELLVLDLSGLSFLDSSRHGSARGCPRARRGRRSQIRRS